MKALCWHGANDIRVESVPDPEILNPHDIILKTSLTAICGSDLHLYDGYMPAMKKGDILGHEFMGEVVETGPEVKKIKKGDRVVVPFPISCGHCNFCRHDEFSFCDNSNPKAWANEKMYGHSGAAIFGYSHIFGGYAGGQAEYVRVPYGDVGPLKVPDSLSDEQVLFLSDIYPTGYQAALNCCIRPGDVIAVWGCGPVGQFAIRSGRLLGAERIIAIDRVKERLVMAEQGGAETINYEKMDLFEAIKEMTGGRGPDGCIDAVGMEAHGAGTVGAFDKAMQMVRMQTDRPTALRQAIKACRKGGTISIPGVYGGTADMFNIGAAFSKGLTLRMGQTHVQRYMPVLLQQIEKGKIDPSFVITHRLPLEEGRRGYEIFREKQDGCIKVVLQP